MKRFPIENPTPEQIRAARELAGLDQTTAAQAAGLDKQQRWSEYERDKRTIDNVRWQWFLLQVGLHPKLRLEVR
jgi:DNA-binding XRE family transcriptional regulator